MPEKNISNINMKIESYRQELLDNEERELLRTLNFDRNELAASKSAEHLVPATKTASDTNISQKSVIKIKPITAVEDLKSKLLQTQEVVDRGIQTARELNESVDELRNKSFRVDRYDELSLIKSRSSERLGKSDSRSTIKTVELKRCKRCNCEIGSKREIKQKVQKNEENVQVMKVIGTDAAPRKHRRLILQQLPSLNIQGDLSCQKIPSVDIPPGKRENLPARANTTFQTWSHEEILRSRIENMGEEIKRSDSVVRLDVKGTKCMQCTNCGKVLTLRGNITEAKQIDDLLKKCDYNVFDPRIEEFAEKCNVKVDEEAKCTQTEEEHQVVLLSEDKRDKTETTDKKVNEDVPVFERKLKIKDLSSDLTRKYREKAAELESDHLHFESILRDLFKKVEESRHLLKNCDYLNGVVSGEKQKSSLNVTTPVLLSYTGSGEEIDDGKNAVLRPSRIHKSKLPAKVIRKKLEKRELDANCRLINSSHSVKDKAKIEDKMTTNSGTPPKGNTFLVPVRTNGDLEESEKLKKELANQRKIYRERSKVLSVANELPDLKTKQILLVESKEEERTKQEEPQKPEQKEPTPKPASFPPQSSSPNNVNLEVLDESVKLTTTITDYESDFEEDSIEEQAVSPEKNDNSHQFNTRLSTISEADSEVDPKISDLPEDNVPEEPRKESPETKEKLTLESLRNKLSATSDTSSDEGDTKKLLKKVNRDLREIASQELLSVRREEVVKNLQQEMTEPLKEVLDELKSQFQRTEILANKLTESIKEVKSSETLSGRVDLITVSSLERMRREVENTLPKKPTKEESGIRALSQRRTSEGEILSDSSSGTSFGRGRQTEEMQSPRQRLMTERPLSKSVSLLTY